MQQYQKLMLKFTKAPFVQYEEILLDKNFRQHLETIIVPKKILRMGAEKTPIQKTYEIQNRSDSLSVEFLGANRQFDWIEISIVPDKSDKYANLMIATTEKWPLN